jgi:hypothetical protein
MEGQMKTISLIVILCFGFIHICSAQDTVESLTKQLNDASGIKTTGIIVTTLGGLVLGGTIVYFVFGGLEIAHNPYSLSRILTYSEIGVSGVILGALGLGIGIPFIIAGQVKETSARNRLNEINNQKNQVSFNSIEPIAGFDPINSRLSLGFIYHF